MSFVNPKNFISWNHGEPPEELGHHAPLGHDRARDRPATDGGGTTAPTYSGCLPLRLVTRSPLLLLDAGRAAKQPVPGRAPNHLLRTVPPRTRETADGTVVPDFAGSALKGALSAAYEAITVSRARVLADHDVPLATRMPARIQNRKLRPGWVTGRTEDSVTVTWVSRLASASSWRPTTRPQDWGRVSKHGIADDPLPAVWVPIDTAQCPRPGLSDEGLSDSPQVHAWIHLHLRPRRNTQDAFLLWRASDVAAPGQLPSQPTSHATDGTPHPYLGLSIKVAGRLHWTGSTFPVRGLRKHDERLVVTELLQTGEPVELSHQKQTFPQSAILRWEGLIDSYVAAHRYDRSRKGLGTYINQPDKWRSLPVGRTLHIATGGGFEGDIQPAMIGREPYLSAVSEVIPDKIRPAREITELSAADRLFGWVAQAAAEGRSAAHRAPVTLDPPEVLPCEAETVRLHNDPVAVQPLAAPKPAQLRVYAEDADGKVIDVRRPASGRDGYRKSATTSNGTPLADVRPRGRAIYLAQADVRDGKQGSDAYWSTDGTAEDERHSGGQRYREWMAQSSSPDRLTTAITGWVPAGVTFTTRLCFENLTGPELGALIWMLTLDEVEDGEHTLQMGYGRPLGFGQVAVSLHREDPMLLIDSVADVKRDLRSIRRLPVESSSAEAKVMQRRQEFVELAETSGPLRRATKAFEVAARGVTGSAVLFPRAHPPDATREEPTEVPPRRTEGYEWSVANERSATPAAMPQLLDARGGPQDLGMPYLRRYMPSRRQPR